MKTRFSIEGTQQSIRRVYRGQHMSASELKQLKACVGGTIAMTSFVSTTEYPDVAEMFAGNGEHRPDIESVIFEVIIDESDCYFERSPFANISEFSSKKAEEEVLLCLGTVFCVESVETKEQVTWIRVRMCQRDDNAAQRQMAKEFGHLVREDSNVDETVSLSQLAVVLYFMGDFSKFEQVARVIQSSIDSWMDPVLAIRFEYSSLYMELVELDPNDANHGGKFQKILGKLKKLVRSVLDSHQHDNQSRDPFISQIFLIDDVLQSMNSDSCGIDISKSAVEFFKSLAKCCRIDMQPTWNLMRERKIAPLIERLEIRDKSNDFKMLQTIQAYCDGADSDKDYDRIDWWSHLAKDAYDNGDYGHAIRFLHEGLSIPSTKVDQVVWYRDLVLSSFIEENWLAAIEYCQAIINMPQLPPCSPFFVQAYMNCAHAYRELGDLFEALLSYTKALELQHQHQAPRHPLTAEVYMKLGILFSSSGDADTAVNSFQTAIALDSPNSTSDAHEWLARTYTGMKKYHEARSHIFHCLDIRELDPCSKTFKLIKPYLALIEIEHITGHYQERNLYLQQALSFADSIEEVRDVVCQDIQRILDIPTHNTQLSSENVLPR